MNTKQAYDSSKPETQQWLDKVVPLLAWLKDGKEVKYRDSHPVGLTFIDADMLLLHPERYSIHSEPREFFINIHDNGGIVAHPSYSDAKPWCAVSKGRTIRVIEDPTWKPEDK